MPDVYYARPSNFLSDPRDRTVIIGDSEDDVLQKMVAYLSSDEARSRYPEGYIEDPADLENNIRKCIFRKGTKAIHNRPPDADGAHH
ncbi:MAG: hypothetical protein OXI54_08520 [Chloroflexota bacterium]|nr:hypothetical protein [Chloroflexota bacterium]MDE2684179.1 hypothetical protein [Chloroflexota bacterium]